MTGISTLAEELARLREENERLKEAVRWALGETSFRPRMTDEGAFWWRTELRKLSGLSWYDSPNNPHGAHEHPADTCKRLGITLDRHGYRPFPVPARATSVDLSAVGRLA